MTTPQLRLIGYLSWVDDEDFTDAEWEFLKNLSNTPEAVLSPVEDHALWKLHALRGY